MTVNQQNKLNAGPVFIIDPTTGAPIVSGDNPGDGIPVLAGQTVKLGATGAKGDFFDTMWITAASLSPGAVTFVDGAGTAYTAFPGGSNSVSNLVPFPFSPKAFSKSGAWSVTCGTNVNAWCTGSFTESS